MPPISVECARRCLHDALYLIALLFCLMLVVGCGEPVNDDDATLPPATVIRATEPAPTSAASPTATPLPQPPALPADTKQLGDYPYPNPHLGTSSGTVYPTATPGVYPTP